MKSLFLALLAVCAVTSVSSAAFAKSKYITVEVCEMPDRGPSITPECRMVTYLDRGPSPVVAANPATDLCQLDTGDHTVTVSCASIRPVTGAVPQWLKDLNEWFTSRGYTAPPKPKFESNR